MYALSCLFVPFRAFSRFRRFCRFRRRARDLRQCRRQPDRCNQKDISQPTTKPFPPNFGSDLIFQSPQTNANKRRKSMKVQGKARNRHAEPAANNQHSVLDMWSTRTGGESRLRSAPSHGRPHAPSEGQGGASKKTGVVHSTRNEPFHQIHASPGAVQQVDHEIHVHECCGRRPNRTALKRMYLTTEAHTVREGVNTILLVKMRIGYACWRQIWCTSLIDPLGDVHVHVHRTPARLSRSIAVGQHPQSA